MIRYIIAPAFVVIFCLQSVYCQNNLPKINDLKFGMSSSHYDTKVPDFKLKEKGGFPDNFPLQLGGEYGYGFRKDMFRKKEFMFWQVFVDVNLYKKGAFLKLEYGEARNTKEPEDKWGYGSLGLNVKVMNENQHKIYMHAALGLSGYVPFLVLSTKYMYALNKYLGVTFGGRYLLAVDYWLGLFGGIQIFTN